MGNKTQLISSYGYLIGCFLLIPASLCLIYEKVLFGSICIYIVACSFLTFAAFIDFFECLSTKPKITNIKVGDVSSSDTEGMINNNSDNYDEKYKNWVKQMMITVFYVNGGILFLLGSILYWPDFSSETNNAGTWVFRFGSINYLCGSFLGLYNNCRRTNTSTTFVNITCMWNSVIIQYIFGALCFILGGILSQTGNKFSSETWLVGSVLFFGGALTGVITTHKYWN